MLQGIWKNFSKIPSLTLSTRRSRTGAEIRLFAAITPRFHCPQTMWCMDSDACLGCFEKTRAKRGFASFAASMRLWIGYSLKTRVPDTQGMLLDTAVSFDVRI